MLCGGVCYDCGIWFVSSRSCGGFRFVDLSVSFNGNVVLREKKVIGFGY